MKKWILFIVSFLPLLLPAQDPGTSIYVRIVNNEKPVSTNIELQQYSLTLNHSKNHWAINDDDPKDAYWRYFDWSPYHGEILNIQILHAKDTMNIELNMDLKNNSKAHQKVTMGSEGHYLFNVVFTLEVPFNPGYYIVDKFVPGSWEIEYKLAPGFKWKNNK